MTALISLHTQQVMHIILYILRTYVGHLESPKPNEKEIFGIFAQAIVE